MNKFAFKKQLILDSESSNSKSDSSQSVIQTPTSKPRLPEGYDFIQELGHGAFGQVVKAFDKKRNKMVAIKLQRFPEHEKIFEKEISNLTKLSNDCENLVCIIDSGLFYKKHYIVMEFISGKTLTKYMNENKNSKMLEYIFRQLITVVKKLHAKGFAHMDIKPDNIIIDSNDKVYLVDLGLACFDNICEGGTKKFLPPDLSFGNISVKERQKADVWAIGFSLAKIINQEEYAKNVFKDIENDKDFDDIPSNIKLSEYLKQVLRLLSPKKQRMKIFKSI